MDMEDGATRLLLKRVWDTGAWRRAFPGTELPWLGNEEAVEEEVEEVAIDVEVVAIVVEEAVLEEEEWEIELLRLTIVVAMGAEPLWREEEDEDEDPLGWPKESKASSSS